jgi:CheY-like chemotaxis protein
LAEDNDMNRDLFARMLRLNGYEVLEARNGQQAVETATTDQPEVVLMDLSMPVMDGWEAAGHLKDSDETADIPIVAVTAHAGETEREKALAAGCDAYLSKPFDFEDLFDLVESFLQ